MTNSFQGGTFDPIRQEDYVPALEQNFKLQERGFDRYERQLRENNRRQAEMAGETFKALSALSSKIGKIVQARQEEFQQREFAQGMSDYYEFGFPKEESDKFEFAEAKEADDQAKLNKLGAKVEKETGPWTAERFRGLSAHRQLGLVSAYVSQQSLMYNPLEVDGILDSKDPQELQSKLSQYRLDAYKKLNGINPAIINKYFFTQQRKIEADLYHKFNQKRVGELKSNRLEDAYQGFRADLKAGNAGQGFIKLLNLTTPDYQNPGEARTQNLAKVKADIDSGVVTGEDVTAIGDAIIDHRGMGKVAFKDAFPTDFYSLQKALDAKAEYDYQRKENRDKIDFSNDEDSIIEELGDNFSEDEVEKQQDYFVKKYGKRSTKLDTYKKEFSHEAITKEKYTKAAEQLAEDNLLTTDRLSKFPYYVRRQFQDVAQGIDALHKANKVPLKAIEDAVKFKGKTLPNGNTHPSVGIKIAEQKAKYLELVESMQIADIADAEQKAMTIVLNDFEKNPGINKQGIFDVIQDSDKETATTAAFKKMEIDSYLDAMGASSLDSPEAFYSTEELVGLVKGYGTLGWTTSPRVNYIAQRLDVDPLTAMNRMLKAANLPTLDETDSIKALNEKVQPEKRTLINKTNNPSRSVRAWGSTGEDNISIVPDGQGQELADLAKESGGLFAEYAAALDILPKLDLNNLTGMEDDEDLLLEYNKSIYKYSGGTNLEALNNTLRPDFK